jgi:hypothetical protein
MHHTQTGTIDPTREDTLTRSVERYTAQLPSSAFLGIAVGAIGLALLSQVGGRGKWGNFVAQWVPTILIMGVYNKLVKLEGQRRTSGSAGAPADSRGAGISNRSLDEEHDWQEGLPQRGARRRAG